jgi:NAD(P)H-flavin reductase
MSVCADIVGRSGHPVQRITLNLNDAYPFEAGQYLSVLGEDIEIPLSIASAPHRLPELEIHYRSTPGVPEAAAMDALLLGSHLRLSAAQGEVRCGPAQRPLLLVAGGSGAAQAFSCAEHRAWQNAAQTAVVWCADHSDDVYETQRLANYVNGQLQICIDSRRTAQNEGMVWLREHCQQYRGHNVILCGSPAFVYTVTDLLCERGFDRNTLQSDVYAYAPRVD